MSQVLSCFYPLVSASNPALPPVSHAIIYASAGFLPFFLLLPPTLFTSVYVCDIIEHYEKDIENNSCHPSDDIDYDMPIIVLGREMGSFRLAEYYGR